MIRNRRVVVLPSGVMEVRYRAPAAVAAAAGPWWLSGGISAVNCIGAYQPKGAASLAASYVNLANPGTYDCQLGDAPTWATGTGWTFDGSADFLRTLITPASGWSLVIAVNSVDRTAQGDPFARRTGTNTDRFGMSFGASTDTNYLSGAAKTVLDADTSGVFGMAGQTAYKNGSALSGAIGAWGTNGTSTLDIGARGASADGTTHFFHFKGVMVAAAVYDTTLSAPQMLALATAMAAL